MSLQDVWYAYNVGKTLYKRQAPFPTLEASTGPYRPSTWKGLPIDDVNQLMYIKTNIGGFFFDAIIRTEHTSTLKMTDHPVQTGANIVDHSYMEPAQLVMEIGMSDTMDSMVKGQFTERYSKSVSAYQVLLDLQKARLPLQVHTRLNLYKNMLIESIDAPDDYKTQFGLRCTVTMKEIFVVEVSNTTVSARKHSTGSTNRGAVQPEPMPTVAGSVDPKGTTRRGTN
jgi:hypothetical protein